ncbi:MAG: hypothetical protein ACMXYK_01250 [Candidatus Woesearchaeota archaeon]
MGFGDIASQIILFISIVTLTAGVAILLGGYANQTSQSLQVQQNTLVDEIRTDFRITSVAHFSGNPDTIILYVKNTGRTAHVLDNIEVFISGLRVEHGNRVITVEADTDIGNPLHWDRGEIIRIDVTQNIDPGVHTIRVVTPNGVWDESTFST